MLKTPLITAIALPGILVTAALFLQRFAPASGAWAHMDIFAWNPRARPGYPEGGEAQAMRACYAMLKSRYGG